MIQKFAEAACTPRSPDIKAFSKIQNTLTYLPPLYEQIWSNYVSWLEGVPWLLNYELFWVVIKDNASPKFYPPASLSGFGINLVLRHLVEFVEWQIFWTIGGGKC